MRSFSGVVSSILYALYPVTHIVCFSLGDLRKHRQSQTLPRHGQYSIRSRLWYVLHLQIWTTHSRLSLSASALASILLRSLIIYDTRKERFPTATRSLEVIQLMALGFSLFINILATGSIGWRHW